MTEDKRKCHKHSPYWETHYGNCMACRAENAEAALATAKADLAAKDAKIAEQEGELTTLRERVRLLEGVADLADALVVAYRDKFRDVRDPKRVTWGFVESKKDAYDASKSALSALPARPTGEQA